MDRQRIWKFIAKQLTFAKCSAKESDYQAAIYDIFIDEDLLGWPADRVIREFPIQMGSTKKSDIVLLDDKHIPLIAIEVKLGDSLTEGIEQLGSYMDRCSPRLKFGITIKNSINLFYDKNTGRSLHSAEDSVLSARIVDCSNNNGQSFVDLFCFTNFSVEKLTDFCETQRVAKQNEEIYNDKVRKVREHLTGENRDVLIKRLLTEYFVSIGIISIDDENVINDAYISNELQKSANGKPDTIVQKSSSGIEKIFVPTKLLFIERLKKDICYRHYLLRDGSVHTEAWRSGGNITEKNINGNITSGSYYREFKDNIVQIVLSPYSDPNQR